MVVPWGPAEERGARSPEEGGGVRVRGGWG
jgi:hypothetical protein